MSFISGANLPNKMAFDFYHYYSFHQNRPINLVNNKLAGYSQGVFIESSGSLTFILRLSTLDPTLVTILTPTPNVRIYTNKIFQKTTKLELKFFF